MTMSLAAREGLRIFEQGIRVLANLSRERGNW